MKTKLLSAFFATALIGVALSSSSAEARRLFWWQSNQDQNYDNYGDNPDAQDAYAQDQFNQEQYDLYMRQMHRRGRAQYDQSYYDPQVVEPDYNRPVRKLKKKKVVRQAHISDSGVIASTPVPPKPVAKKAQTGQVASIGRRFDAPAAAKAIDCGKGASIVTGYGFSGVTTKSCSGSSFVYGANRSGKAFEIQVNSANGEIMAVKKL
jgi:hypothetical protein